MRRAEEIKLQLAELFGCDPGELAGENILATLEDADRYSGSVYVMWAVVQATIDPSEVFPS